MPERGETRRGLCAVGAALLLLGGVVPGAAAQDGAVPDLRMSDISGPAEQPRRHFRVEDPARLPVAEVERIYVTIAGALSRAYAASGDDVGRGYAGWPRFNDAPYLSATHGNHYVNHYANETARDYGRFEDAGTLPVGAIVAKDSFSVTRFGGVLLGPLFVMEKMPEGFNPGSGDWRYSMIRSDGRLVGRTGGPGAERVQHCIGCHLAREQDDHLYFIPEARRVLR